MLIVINLKRFWYLGQQEVYENVDFNNKDDLLKWLDLDYTQVNTAHHLRNKVRTICTLYRNYCIQHYSLRNTSLSRELYSLANTTGWETPFID